MDPADSQPKTSGLAITSLVLGISGILLCCCGLLGLPAVIIGHVARGRIKASAGALTGSGVALAGLITGYLSIAVMLIGVFSTIPQLGNITVGVRTGLAGAQIHAAAQKTGIWPADAGIASTSAYIQALASKGGLAEAQAAALNLQDVLVGNVAASDSDSTIVVRSKTGALKTGAVMAFLKDGNFEFYTSETDAKESAPPREPPFLTP